MLRNTVLVWLHWEVNEFQLRSIERHVPLLFSDRLILRYSMLLLTSTLHHRIESNGGSLNQRERFSRFSRTSLPPVIVTEVSTTSLRSGWSARLISEQSSSVSSVTGTGQISTPSVILLSLTGNDLIILQMNCDINLFHKHFLCEFIKTVWVELTVIRKEMFDVWINNYSQSTYT